MSWGIRPDQCHNFQAPSPLDWDAPVGHSPSIHREPSGLRQGKHLPLPFTPRIDMTVIPAELQCEVEAARLAEELAELALIYVGPILELDFPGDGHSLAAKHFLAVRVGLMLNMRVEYRANARAYHFHYHDGFHPLSEVLL